MKMHKSCWRATVGVALAGGLALLMSGCHQTTRISGSTKTTRLIACRVHLPICSPPTTVDYAHLFDNLKNEKGDSTTTTMGTTVVSGPPSYYVNEYNTAMGQLNGLLASTPVPALNTGQVNSAIAGAYIGLTVLNPTWPPADQPDVNALTNALNTMTNSSWSNDTSEVNDLLAVVEWDNTVAVDLGVPTTAINLGKGATTLEAISGNPASPSRSLVPGG
jgi:hypothetical protein